VYAADADSAVAAYTSVKSHGLHTMKMKVLIQLGLIATRKVSARDVVSRVATDDSRGIPCNTFHV
jgi:hypothetical protein